VRLESAFIISTRPFTRDALRKKSLSPFQGMNLWGKRAGSTNLTNYGDVGVKHGQEVPFVLWHGIPS